VLEVGDAVLPDAEVVGRQEDDQRQPTVMFIFCVGGRNPGMSPSRFMNRMKTKHDASSGRYFL
jgi:hypothetical protein